MPFNRFTGRLGSRNGVPPEKYPTDAAYRRNQPSIALAISSHDSAAARPIAKDKRFAGLAKSGLLTAACAARRARSGFARKASPARLRKGGLGLADNS